MKPAEESTPRTRVAQSAWPLVRPLRNGIHAAGTIWHGRANTSADGRRPKRMLSRHRHPPRQGSTGWSVGAGMRCTAMRAAAARRRRRWVLAVMNSSCGKLAKRRAKAVATSRKSAQSRSTKARAMGPGAMESARGPANRSATALA